MKTMWLLLGIGAAVVLTEGCAHARSPATADTKLLVTIEGESQHVGRVLASLPVHAAPAPTRGEEAGVHRGASSEDEEDVDRTDPADESTNDDDVDAPGDDATDDDMDDGTDTSADDDGDDEACNGQRDRETRSHARSDMQGNRGFGGRRGRHARWD